MRPHSALGNLTPAAYAKLSGAAIIAAGGRILVRGMPSHVYEAGLEQRTVVIEFDSVEHTKAAHDSPAYQEALAALAGGAERDIRIVRGGVTPVGLTFRKRRRDGHKTVTTSRLQFVRL